MDNLSLYTREDTVNAAQVNNRSLFLEPSGTQMYFTTVSKSFTCFQVGSKHNDINSSSLLLMRIHILKRLDIF